MNPKQGLLLLALLAGFQPANTQSKSEVLRLYLLRLPEPDSMEKIPAVMRASSLPWTDSIGSGGAIFSRYKGEPPFADAENGKIRLGYQAQAWRDSATRKIFDTSHTLTVHYLFDEADDHGRKRFYKEVCKLFRRFYLFNSEHTMKDNFNGKFRRFTNGQFNNFAELMIYEGHDNNNLFYVSIQYQKRKVYQILAPGTTIRVRTS